MLALATVGHVWLAVSRPFPSGGETVLVIIIAVITGPLAWGVYQRSIAAASLGLFWWIALGLLVGPSHPGEGPIWWDPVLKCGALVLLCAVIGAVADFLLEPSSGQKRGGPIDLT